ncbi:MAG TPA: hypothetical protein VM901_01720 [Bdellovibrionota bacterium]|jgi:hypothetical protein|nr:hypothetical protein [Bdellovibrionota bacterium]
MRDFFIAFIAMLVAFSALNFRAKHDSLDMTRLQNLSGPQSRELDRGLELVAQELSRDEH